jgi:hypothetical protein
MLQTNLYSQNNAQAKMNFSEAVAWVSSVVANDSSCAIALNTGTGSGNLTYNDNSASTPMAYIGGPFLSGGKMIAQRTAMTGTPAPIGQPIELYGLGGKPYMWSYGRGASSTTNAILGKITMLDVILLINNHGAGIPVSGTTNVIYQANIYLSAMKPIFSLTPNTLLADQSIPVNIQVDSYNHVIGCSGFRLGNGTSLSIPTCTTVPSQTLFSNGIQFTCLNAGCPSTWNGGNATGVTSAGYIPPNTDLTQVTNGGITPATPGYVLGAVPGWRSSVGCSYCLSTGQDNTTGTYTGSLSPTGSTVATTNSKVTVNCVNTSCPPGWHSTTDNTVLGVQPPHTDFSKIIGSGVTPSTLGYINGPGWQSTLTCAPGSTLGSCVSTGPFCNSTYQGGYTQQVCNNLNGTRANPQSSSNTPLGLVGNTYCSTACTSAISYDYCALNNGGWGSTTTKNTGLDSNGHLYHTAEECITLGGTLAFYNSTPVAGYSNMCRFTNTGYLTSACNNNFGWTPFAAYYTATNYGPTTITTQHSNHCTYCPGNNTAAWCRQHGCSSHYVDPNQTTYSGWITNFGSLPSNISVTYPSSCNCNCHAYGFHSDFTCSSGTICRPDDYDSSGSSDSTANSSITDSYCY